VTVAAAIRAAGASPADILALARRLEDLLGYIEVHIEQGPVLLEESLPLGIVTAIAGAARYTVTITGVAGHAGTVPMAARRDALAAAAELVLFVEQRCRNTPGVVGTVGQIGVADAAANVIPGHCELSLDIRADEAGKLDAAIGDVMAQVRKIEASRNVSIAVSDRQRTPVVPCSPRMQRLLAGAVERAGAAVRHLPSGAGHDALMFHGMTDIGMLFVRCGNGGVSHSPLETIAEADAGLAARVLLDALKYLHDAC
jgi:allantoate deiminase/N-carbamoyl-L-amino-acid hydrolase